MKPIVYFRDGFVAADKANLSIASAPVLYGLSIYTVFPVFRNAKTGELNMFRLRDHFQRLQNSAKIMAFSDFSRDWKFEEFEKVMRELLVQNKPDGDCLVRINVFVDDVLQGTRMHGLKHSVSAFVYTVPALPKTGVKLGVSSWRRTPDNAIPSRAKINGSYVNASLAKHEALMNGFDDAVLLDEHEHVAESTVSNIFMIRDGKLITPSGSTDLLEGITRDSVFRMAEKLKLHHEQRSVDRSELYLADEIFLCGSSLQIVPVIEIDHRKIADGKPGKITKDLMNSYDLHGRDASLSDWLTPVVLK